MSLFEPIEQLPEDPILSLPIAFAKDSRPRKVNLGIGAYRDEDGRPALFSAVKKAEALLLEKNLNKEYLPIEGNIEFLHQIQRLIFGHLFVKEFDEKAAAVQTVGGTGALRIGSDFLVERQVKTIFLPMPSWPNHRTIFQASGMKIGYYPYYDTSKKNLDFAGMLKAIEEMPENSAILLHASSHNPTGMDLDERQWQTVKERLKACKILPFFDFAYQGLGKSIEEDAFSIRLFAEDGLEMLVAHSCAKNFGLYGERLGALVVMLKEKSTAVKVKTHLKQIIRGAYSTPPLHPSRIVFEILSNSTLKREWEDELNMMKRRIEKMRNELADGLSQNTERDFGFLKAQKGIFSFLGLEKEKVEALKEENAIYMPSNGRLNVAGLNQSNILYVIESISSVLKL